jgi:hypothetical protein
VHTTGLTGGTLEVTSPFFWDLRGCKVYYKILEYVFRGDYTKLQRRIETSEARSVLPIWFPCWNYQNHQYYWARVEKTTKGSLARPRAVTGLTGSHHRSDRWCPTATHGLTVKESILYHPPSLSSIIHQHSSLYKTVKALSPLSFHLSLLPWRFKVSTKERPQDWKQKDLPKLLHWFPFEFFGFFSSSSLQRYSNLLFARSLYSVQIFEFPLVYHLLRTPRRHTYKSIKSCWTHCENPRFGVGRSSPFWPVEDHVWFEDRWMIASLCDEWLTMLCGLTLG